MKTPQFEKKQPVTLTTSQVSNVSMINNYNNSHNINNNNNKRYDNNKKRDKYSYNNNKGQEITDDDWEAIRKFQATIFILLLLSFLE